MSDTKIRELSQLKVEKLKISTGIAFQIPNTQEKIITREILYQQKPLLIQTPHLYLPFGLSKPYQKDQYNLYLSFLPNDEQHQKFKTQVQDFEELLVSQMDELLEENLHNTLLEHVSYHFSESIKQGDDLFYPPALRAKSHPQAQLQIYDLFSKVQPNSYLMPGSWATVILYPKHLWFRHSPETATFGLTWYALQAKVRPPIPILENCQIKQDNWTTETLCSICYKRILKSDGHLFHQPQTSEQLPTPSLPTEYEKYTKMLKLGIPLLATIQRCQMDGLDPEVLRQYKPQHSVASSNAPPAPPPPPPPPKTKTKSSQGPPRLLFTANDLKNVANQLGKKEIKIKIPKKKMIRLKKRDPRVPSLDMILDQLNCLKRTNLQLEDL